MSATALYRSVQHLTDDDLVRTYTPLVHRIAHHLMAGLPASVDVQDLIQSGMIGLLGAAKNYTTSHAASFETFAGIRIRGSMLDELRRSDWTPRSVHRKVREVAQATREVERETGRDADSAAVMQRLGIDRNEYNRILADAARSRVLSLSRTDNTDGTVADVADTAQRGPAEDLEESALQDALAAAITSCPNGSNW